MYQYQNIETHDHKIINLWVCEEQTRQKLDLDHKIYTFLRMDFTIMIL